MPDISWGGRGTNAVIRLLYVILLTRFLGPEPYGRFISRLQVDFFPRDDLGKGVFLMDGRVS